MSVRGLQGDLLVRKLSIKIIAGILPTTTQGRKARYIVSASSYDKYGKIILSALFWIDWSKFDREITVMQTKQVIHTQFVNE